jgi:hypothetical protein
MTSHKAHNIAGWDAAVLDARRLVARALACRALPVLPSIRFAASGKRATVEIRV